MFTPNQQGILRIVTGRDVRGRPSWGTPNSVSFGIVSLNVGAMKTSVRADSSASRGSADEKAMVRGKVLFAKTTVVKNDAILTFDGSEFKVISVHSRYGVTGRLDHYECDLEFYADET